MPGLNCGSGLWNSLNSSTFASTPPLSQLNCQPARRDVEGVGGPIRAAGRNTAALVSAEHWRGHRALEIHQQQAQEHIRSTQFRRSMSIAVTPAAGKSPVVSVASTAFSRDLIVAPVGGDRAGMGRSDRFGRRGR